MFILYKVSWQYITTFIKVYFHYYVQGEIGKFKQGKFIYAFGLLFTYAKSYDFKIGSEERTF